MEKFSIWDLAIGFIGNRLRRLVRRPDVDFVTNDLAIGGVTKVEGFHIVDARVLEEDEHPELPLIDKLVEEIGRNIKEGKKVFVHCRVGRGRAPLVAVCYLMKNHGLSLEAAIREVRLKRPYMFLNGKQLSFLKNYERSLHG